MDDSANKLQYLIDTLGITPSAFADNIGEKRPTGVYNVLKGTYRMSPELAKKIVAAYENVNIDWLLRNKGEAEGNSQRSRHRRVAYHLLRETHMGNGCLITRCPQ